MDQLQRIISTSCLSKNYFKILHEMGFEEFRPMFESSPYKRDFHKIISLYDRYGTFDLMTAGLKEGGEASDLIKLQVALAKADVIACEDAEALSNSSFVARSDAADTIKHQLAEMIRLQADTEIRKVNHRITELMNHDHRAD